MKHFSAKFLSAVSAVLILGLTGSGCSKIKTLVAKKKAANAAPAATASPDPGGTTPEVPVATQPGTSKPATAATTTPLATPVKPVAPAVNKNAAVMVLCYHRLEEKPRPKDPLAMTPAEFEKEMQAIKDANFSVIPMQDFLAWRRGDKDIPPKCAVITIDDGYASGYDTAWPILKKFGYPFTMFVYINYIGSGGKSISWDQLEEMRDAGVDIQSHSYSHGNLRNPNDKYAVDKHNYGLIQADVQALGPDGWLRKEVAGSKQELEKRLGIKVNALAYPFGKYDQKVREVVKEAGYEAAFTVYGQRISHGSPASDVLGRYAVEQNTPKIFQDALTMVGGGGGGPLPNEPTMAQMASSSMVTQPAQGETITNPKPLIKVNLAAMGDVDPASVKMRLSGSGIVKSTYDRVSRNLSYQVDKPLVDKNITVIISALVGGKPAETRWDFNYDPTKAPAAASAKPAAKP